LKRSGYWESLRQVFVLVSACFFAVGQRPLPTPAMAGFQAFFRHDAFNDRIGCRDTITPENAANTVNAINALTVAEHSFNFLTPNVVNDLPAMLVITPSVISGCGNAKLFGPLRLGVWGFGVHQVIKIGSFYF
jgi:hypothetical protein